MTTCKTRPTDSVSSYTLLLSRTGQLTYDFNSDVLKMDIEFAEYDALDALSQAFPASAGMEFPLGQVMIEIHLFPGRISAEEYLGW